MLMVVFGAGASFDSVNTRFTDMSSPRPRDPSPWPYQPPLAGQLFDDRPSFGEFVHHYPRVRPLVHELRTLADGTNIEDELGRYQREGEAGYRARITQLAALRFYLRAVVARCAREWENGSHGVTNYVRLVDHLRHWQHRTGEDLLLVTFNYDCMLEWAWASEAQSKFTSMEDYLNQPKAKLIKVHGSTNWVRRVAPQSALLSTENELIAEAPDLVLTDQLMCSDENPRFVPRNNEHYFPAIAVPVRDKTTFECPSDHLQALVERLPRVTRLLVIGWAGADRHFLDLCTKNGLQPDQIRVACGPGSDDAVNVIARSGLRINIDPIVAGFSELLTTNLYELEGFLDLPVKERG